MRNRSIANELEVYAVAGAHTAVLSFDFKNKPQGLLGFALERQETKTGKRIWLEGQKCFQSIIPDPVKGQRYPTHLHPIQSFLWKDFTLTPGEAYKFKVTPVLGKPNQLQYGPPEEISLTAEKEYDGHQGIYFNRGVSGSQSFADNFPSKKISSMNEATKERALLWLSRGLFEGLKSYIETAEQDEYLYGAFYEFHEPRTLQLLKAAHKRGVKVALIVDGKQYGDENRQAVGDAGMTALVKKWRTKAKIPHNKFLIHCTASGKAIRVWTGSTNISEKGIFGQCNTGHVVKDSGIASQYMEFWKALKDDPTHQPLVTAVMGIQADLDVNQLPDNTVTAFFSPRDSLKMLDVYASLVAGANELACGIFPFNVDARFQDAFNLEKDFPRYVIVDRSSSAFEANDRDLDIAAGAFIKSSVDQWLKETSAATLFYGGTDYVHNKILIIDPLGASPIIVSGSANLSKPSTDSNDENMLVVKGGDFKREADIYFTEFVRLFDHFQFREWLNTKPTDFKPFLEEGPAPDGRSWVDKYFDSKEFLSFKRKMTFKNMVL
jgi:hypothetical protein